MSTRLLIEVAAVGAEEGIYQYQVTLLGNGGISFATATASFEVLNDLNAAIRGTVVAQSSELPQGDSQACAFTTLTFMALAPPLMMKDTSDGGRQYRGPAIF